MNKTPKSLSSLKTPKHPLSHSNSHDTPAWFKWAMSEKPSSNFLQVEGCQIHYLLWDGPKEEDREGSILFVHGGAAHSHWWSFLAPFFTNNFRVAALDLSGMGDSGRREEYSAEMRATEINSVINDANLGKNTYVIGHSFGGLMTAKFAKKYGGKISGILIVDSPIRPPREHAKRKHPRQRGKRYYSDFASAVARFRLMPEQDCSNDFLISHIAQHSVVETPEGWTWKFDEGAMHARRFKEPYHQYLKDAKCKVGLVYGEKSSLLDQKTVTFMRSLMPEGSPVISIPEAQHHLLLDQPMAFISVTRLILQNWKAKFKF